MEVWVLRFDRVCADCEGVYSTKEKAINAFETHAKRCHDIWKEIEIAEDSDNFRTYEFVIGDEIVAADIYLTTIDAI